jgi:hypothetical protein
MVVLLLPYHPRLLGCRGFFWLFARQVCVLEKSINAKPGGSSAVLKRGIDEHSGCNTQRDGGQLQGDSGGESCHSKSSLRAAPVTRVVVIMINIPARA